MRQCFLRYAVASVAHRDVYKMLVAGAASLHTYVHSARVSIFYGIAHKIVYGDGYHLTVEIHVYGVLGSHKAYRHVGFAVQFLIFQTYLMHSVHDVSLLHTQRTVVGLRLAEFQYLRDKLVESHCTLMNYRQLVLGSLGDVGRMREVVERTENESERSAQFVRYVSEESQAVFIVLAVFLMVYFFHVEHIFQSHMAVVYTQCSVDAHHDDEGINQFCPPRQPQWWLYGDDEFCHLLIPRLVVHAASHQQSVSACRYVAHRYLSFVAYHPLILHALQFVAVFHIGVEGIVECIEGDVECVLVMIERNLLPVVETYHTVLSLLYVAEKRERHDVWRRCLMAREHLVGREVAQAVCRTEIYVATCILRHTSVIEVGLHHTVLLVVVDDALSPLWQATDATVVAHPYVSLAVLCYGAYVYVGQS